MSALCSAKERHMSGHARAKPDLRHALTMTPDSPSSSLWYASHNEEAQVDQGERPMVRDPQTGKYPRTRLFSC